MRLVAAAGMSDIAAVPPAVTDRTGGLAGIADEERVGPQADFTRRQSLQADAAQHLRRTAMRRQRDGAAGFGVTIDIGERPADGREPVRDVGPYRRAGRDAETRTRQAEPVTDRIDHEEIEDGI